MITILLAISLIAVVAVFLFNQFFNNSSSSADPLKNAQASVEKVAAKPLSADKRVELTAEIADIKTNLLDTSDIAVLGLAFQMDDKKTKEDFEKLKDIQIKPIIIRVLGDLSREDISGSKGKDMLCSKLLNQINPVLPEGKIMKIEVTNFIVTSI
jgi:flagellar FliL protein